MKKRAVISVSDKGGVVALARGLIGQGIEVISTGGTWRLLRENGLEVRGISDITGFPEIMDGRVKTLHPAIHGGILAVRSKEKHMEQLAELDIGPIDFVIVNLYPFKETLTKKDTGWADAIENIDIGGPTMLRAAAKNHEHVTVIVDPADYISLLAELENGGVSLETKRRLAAKVFRHTAHYDALIAEYLTRAIGADEPETLTVTYERKQGLRYGENPHQRAAFYKEPLPRPSSIAFAEQLHGKELSYNNINDADAALAMVKAFKEPAAVALKHMNPCGVGVGGTVLEAYTRAWAADPVSIFGGIVALNRAVDRATAEKMREIFLELVIAPAFSGEALAVLTGKKNLRLLTVDFSDSGGGRRLTSVTGGLLVQDEDTFTLENAEITYPTKRRPTDGEWAALRLGWKVVGHVKSNAIVLAKDGMTVGIGAGQMNRVGAAQIAIRQAGEKAAGSVMASDAYFPMPDTVEEAAMAGVTAIIQPGGSVRDGDAVQAADRHGIAMVFTGIRHFRH